MAWKDLSMSDKSQWMRFFIKNGITDAKQMSEHYNSFAEGGNIDDPPQPRFVQRLVQGNSRAYIRDWEDPRSIATHKLSYAEDKGRYYVYPDVQEINGELHDFTDPKYNHGKWDSFDNAMRNGNVLEFPTEEAADNFTRTYKNSYVYPWAGTMQPSIQQMTYQLPGRSFAEGGDKDKPPLAWKGRFVNAGRPQVSGININPFSLKETSYKGVEPDGRLSDEKFNWFRNWYYNRNNQVRKNSILSLHNFNVNKSMAYADNVPIVKDNATFNKYLDDNQKEAFNRSFGNPFLLGYYQPRIDSFKTANRLNPYIIAADDNDTDIHEFTHALQYQGGIAPTKAIESYSYDKNNTYLDDPREIYARLMQMRYRNKLDPKKIWTKEQINALKKDKNFQDVDILNRYDDDMLLYLFNEVADNNTTTELPNYAALGGRLFYNG